MDLHFLPAICPKEISIDEWQSLSWDQQYDWHKENSPESFYFRAILRMEILDRKRLMPDYELPYVLLAEFKAQDAPIAKHFCPAEIWARTKEIVVPNMPDDNDDEAWEEHGRLLNSMWYSCDPHDIVKIRSGAIEWRAAQRSGEIT